MSLPSTARKGATDPKDARVLVCPRCQASWPSNAAPANCPTDGSALERVRDLGAPAKSDPMEGRTLEGRYTILAKLGAGSMGTVYRAKQHAMGREVAIKILRSDRATDESARARFLREAQANSLLASPNTVTVFDFGEGDDGEFYLAMELLEGESLGQRLTRTGRLPVPLAVDAARQALRSLSEAHAKGIIHRDLKPDNLFFARVLTSAGNGPSGEAHDEIVKVLDFGIAKMLRSEDLPMGVIETQAGTVFGTPRYMSPEQAQGKPLDARTDLYSLGVIVYQMLTGRPPFMDDDAVVVMARHIKSAPKRPNEVNAEANVPKELEDVVMRALSKDPADRPASADVFAGELLAALEAQGATSSGVRSAVTNAAGIRLPDSMRPPPVALPAPSVAAPTPGPSLARRRTRLAVAAAAAIAFFVAAGVYVGMRSGTVEPTTATGGTAPTTTVTPTATATVTPTPAAPEATASDEPPAVASETLQAAEFLESTPPSASAAQPRPRARPASKSPKNSAGTSGSAAARSTNPASPTTAPTSRYGVFE